MSLILATKMGWRWADPLFATAIAGYIVWGAGAIGFRALNLLMDRELPDAERERIRQIVLAHPGVRDMHDLRTRSSGLQQFIQLHLEMDGALTLTRSFLSGAVDASQCAASLDLRSGVALIPDQPQFRGISKQETAVEISERGVA